MKKSFLFFYLLFFMTAGSWSQTTVSIGTGTATNQYLPINGYYAYSYTQQIYLKTELNQSEPVAITKVRFYLNYGTPSNCASWVIYLGHTANTSFATTSSWIPLSALTQVYAGDVIFPAVGNWMEITLLTPFIYNNIDNLVVAVDENTPGYSAGSIYWKSFTPGGYRSLYYYNDYNNPNPASPPTSGPSLARITAVNQIQFDVAPATGCFSPGGLTASQITDVSATMQWLSAGSAWEYVYGAAPLAAPAGSGTATTVNSIPVTGLTGSTNYQFYVRTDCGAGEFSPWSGPYSFTTLCQAVTSFPFVEPFNSNSLPSCWTTTGGWYYSSGSTYTSAVNATLTAPLLNLTGWYQCKFNYKVNSGTSSVSIKINNSTLFSLTNVINTTWKTAVFPLTAYNGSKIQISFVGGGSSAIYIDNVTVELTPSCPCPLDPVTVATSPNTALLDWTSTVAENSWQVIYGSLGFNPDTEGTLVTGVNSHPALIDPPFTTETTYEWRVRSLCGSEFSAWSDPCSLTTKAEGDYSHQVGTGTSTSPFLPLHAYYGYSYTQQIYLKNELQLVEAGAITKIRFYLNSGADPINSSSWTIYMGHTDKTGFSSTSDWVPFSELTQVFSGEVTFPAFGNWMEITLNTGFDYNNIQNLLIAVDENTPDWAPGSVYWRAFSPAGYRGLYYYNDDIDPDPVTPPLGTRTNNINQLQCEVLHDAYLLVPGLLDFSFVEFGSSQILSYVLSGGKLTDGPVTVTATENFAISLNQAGPFTSSLLVNYTAPALPGTLIYVKFTPPAFNAMYNGTITHSGGGLEKVIVLTGSSSLYLLYCPSIAENDQGSDITKVILNGISNESDCSTLAPGIGSVQNRYSNYFFDVPPVTIEKLTFSMFSVTMSDCSYGSYFAYLKIYVDFNRDGDFNDTGEAVYESQYSVKPVIEINGSFYVPEDAVLGYTMMRVVAHEIFSGGSTQSCTTPSIHYYFGETEDYMVLIAPAPSCVPPLNGIANNLDDVSASLDWSPIGNETAWEYVLGKAPLSLPNYTGKKSLSATGNFVDKLDPDTEYQFYVRASCGGSNKSQYSGPYSFRTRCAPVTQMWVEEFDSGVFPPACWNVYNTGYSGWYGSSGYAYCYTDDSELETMLFTPAVDSRLKLKYRSGSSYWTASMDILVGNTIIHQIIDAGNTQYEYLFVPLGQYTGQKISVSFVLKNETIYIESVAIEPDTDCPYPLYPNTLSTGSHFASLDWTPYGTETNWEVIYGVPGFDPATEGAIITGIDEHPYIADPPFEALTEYEWRVRAVCDGVPGPWSDPDTFTTYCMPVTDYPFLENFDLSFADNLCWSTFKTGGPSEGTWQVISYKSNPVCYPHSGNYMQYYYSAHYNDGTTGSLCTPPLDLSEEVYKLNFWMYRDYNDNTIEHIDLYINTVPSITGATLLSTIYRRYSRPPVVPYSQKWYQYQFDLPAGVSGNEYFIMWDGYSDDGANMYLDNIAIYKPGGGVSGYVYNSAMEPVSGVKVMDALGQFVTTDDAGYYLIPETAQGESYVTASKSDYCTQTYPVTIPVEGMVTQDIILPPVMNINLVTSAQTVYYNYPPMGCATLSVEITGGTPPYSYEWSTGETTETIEVCPSDYAYYTVNVTDAYGCSPSMDYIYIDIIDVRCGSNMDKVMICHVPEDNPENPVSLCVPVEAVQEHLDHGDQFGECYAPYQSALIADENELSMTIEPNPSSDFAKIIFSTDVDGRISIRVDNLTGQTIHKLFEGFIEDNNLYSMDVPDLPVGVYLCTLTHSDGRTITKKLVRMK